MLHMYVDTIPRYRQSDTVRSEDTWAAYLHGVTWLDLDLEPYVGGCAWIKHDTVVQVVKKATSCTLYNMIYTVTTAIYHLPKQHAALPKVAPFSDGQISMVESALRK
jgi:hypothetical protein